MKRAFSFIVAGILALIFSSHSLAYDFMYCYDRALEQDAKFTAAVFSQKAVQEKLVQAKSRFFPVVNSEIGWTNSWQDIKSDNRVMISGNANFPTQSYLAQVIQPLFHYDYIAGLKQANISVARSVQELELEHQNIIVRVADSYFGILAAMDNLQNIKAEEAAIKIHHDRAEGSYRKGLIPITELEDVRARLASIQADKIEAERVIDTAIHALMEIIGTPLAHLNQMKEDVVFAAPDPDDAEQWIDLGLKKGLSVNIKRLESEEAKKEIDRQKAGHYPSVDLQGNWSLKDAGGSIYGGGSKIDSTEVGVKMNIPIFNGGIINSKIRESMANYNKLLQEVKKEERQVVRQVRDWFHGMKSSAGRIDALKKTVDSRKLILWAKEQGFRSGMNSSVEVLDAAKELNFHLKNYSRAKYEYVMNFLKLKLAAGVLGVADVSLVNQWVN